SAKNTWKQSETSMRNSHIGVYVLAIYSGSNLAFKFVGQSAPCRNDIRILHGSKISLNMQSAVDRFENELKYTEAVFGKVTKDKIRSHISPEESISLRIAAHEVAHAAFVNTETDRKIGFGILPLLEEAKATWSGVATIHQRVKRGSIDEGAVDRLLYLMITANMRYITLRGETTLRPYYTEALMGLNTMIECELISKNDNGYFTLDMQKRDIFYEKMNQLYDTIVSIYDEYNGPLAQRLLAEKTKETPKIIEMYELARQVV
ncbi:MAG TPA: hypothetical protein VJA22_03350, partial [Patescibacteria group bacterium]|nr:hypothetical protein [Patescibacteria group bacterium]